MSKKITASTPSLVEVDGRTKASVLRRVIASDPAADDDSVAAAASRLLLEEKGASYIYQVEDVQFARSKPERRKHGAGGGRNDSLTFAEGFSLLAEAESFGGLDQMLSAVAKVAALAEKFHGLERLGKLVAEVKELKAKMGK